MTKEQNKYKSALGVIAKLSEVTEIRGGFSDLGVPNHLIKEGGWVPINPSFKAGLEYAANIAKKALKNEK